MAIGCWQRSKWVAVSLMAMAVVFAAVALSGGAVWANAPTEWTNKTAPGTISFDVTVDYNDGAGEQTATDSYDVKVMRVRAWEISHDVYTEQYRRPGGVAEFTATIWNLGNAVEDFQLDFETRIGDEGDFEQGAPDGWTVTILVDGGEADTVQVEPGLDTSRQVTVRIEADEERPDGELIQVRLVVTAPEIEADEEYVPQSIDEDDKRTDEMPVKIVANLVDFIVTPGSDDGRGGNEVDPRDTVTMYVEIHNPSWAEVPVKGENSITATIVIPEGITLVLDSVERTDRPDTRLISYHDGTRTLTITIRDEFDSGDILKFDFDVTVDAHLTEGEYIFNGQLVYTDKAGHEHSILAQPMVDGKRPGESGYPSEEKPKIIVRRVYLVQIYEDENGEYPADDPLKKELIRTPGTHEIELWIRNEGNVADSYALKVLGDNEGITISISCAGAETTDVLDPSQQEPCTVTIVVPNGSKDASVAVRMLQAESTTTRAQDNTMVPVAESNIAEFTIEVSAPDIVVTMRVYEDEDHVTPAEFIKPGDTVYVEAVMTNEGSHVAENLNFQHTVPDAIDFLANDVSATHNGQPVNVRVVDRVISLENPIDLEPSETIILTYSGTVK